MRYDRQYGRGRGSRGRGIDYGWGVPVRGMYDYSLDYGGISGPESEDSETIPPYESGPGDWTGSARRWPRYESHHWAAAEPAGEARYRGQERGPGPYDREFGSFRSALEAARARARRGYGRDFDHDPGMWGGPGWGRSRPSGGWSGGGGYGRHYREDWRGGPPGWWGSGEARRGPREAEWGFGWPRQGRPRQPGRDEAARPRGRPRGGWRPSRGSGGGW